MKRRLYELDLFRFVAVIMVVFFHYAFRGYAADNMTAMPYTSLAFFAKYGYLGVYLFFIISGFVILMTASNGSPKRFVISRVVRLYPAFWVCCTITFLVTLLIGGPRFNATIGQYLVNMTMLSGFVGVPSVDFAYWSLFVEMRFYFLIFILLVFGVIGNAEKLLGLWLVSSLVLIQWHSRYVAFLLVPDYAPYFIAGAMFYIMYVEGISLFRGIVVTVSYVVAMWKAILEASDLALHYGVQYDPIVVVSLLTFFFLIFLMVALKKTSWLATSKWLLLGALTYPLYLIHQYVGFMLFNAMYPSLNSHLVMGITILVVISFAYAVNRLVESRYSERLKRLLGRMLAVQTDQN